MLHFPSAIVFENVQTEHFHAPPEATAGAEGAGWADVCELLL